ncbi:MAG: TetR/AcrR family transcriptional regulator [Anderseniella sp.]
MQHVRTGKREQILDVAGLSVVEKGFAATSIEEIIVEVGITKSGFFYHFSDKNELAKALLQRYIDMEETIFRDIEARAYELNEDPLHGFLISLKLLAELLEDLPNGHPGCLIASYCYQSRLFSPDIRALNARALVSWRTRFQQQLERIAEIYPPRIEVDLADVADMLSAIADGGIILSRVLHDKTILPRQVMLYRQFVKALFVGA